MPGSVDDVIELERHVATISTEVGSLDQELTKMLDVAGSLDAELAKILDVAAREAPAVPPVPESPSTETLLSAAGRSFVRAFAGSMIVLLPGILSGYPHLTGSVGLGVAALIASVAAGLRACQQVVPWLTIRSLLPKGKAWATYVTTYADSFLRGFAAAFLTSMVGILSMPTLAWDKSLVVGALVGALAAGLRGVQGALDKNDLPFRDKGITLPAR